MVKTLEVGIIGLGHIATSAHIPAFSQISGVNLAAVSEVSEKQLQSVGKKLDPKVQLFTDYKKMLELDNIDLVSICLPPQLHGQVTLEALKAKKHVLVEKPFTTDLNEAFVIANTSKQVDRRVCLVQNYRYFSAAAEAKKKVLDGIVGKILCLNTTSYVPAPAISPSSQSFLYSKWGILDDNGPHPIDMTNWLISSTPTSIYCVNNALSKATTTTDIQMMVSYANGSTATINISWLAGSTKFELAVLGSAGELILNVNLNQLMEHHGIVTPYTHIRDFGGITKRNFKNIVSGTIFKGSYVNHPPLIRDFVTSILEKRPPPITLAEALRNVMVSEGAKMSLNQKAVVNLEELPIIKANGFLYK